MISSSGNKKDKVIHGIVLISYWNKWKMVNGVIFAGENPNATKTLEEMKSLGYLWMKNRSTFRCMSWKELCNFFL
ncbi:hypothetical protein Hanom_Chr10g00952861 [Helianthus anomalus]